MMKKTLMKKKVTNKLTKKKRKICTVPINFCSLLEGISGLRFLLFSKKGNSVGLV
jgi:hypothetical protein